MPNQRRNLALTLQTPGGDNPLTLRLVQTRPLYTGIAVNGLSLVAKGGKAPYSFAINATSNSDLPPGLTIPDPVGPEKADITGTPTAQGHYTFIAVVTDSDSQSFPHSFSLDVRAPIVWVRYNPVPGENLLSYSYRMVASDLAGNFISAGYALESGNLPDGLTIHDNGTIDGDPTFAAIGTSYATISVTTPDGSASIPIAINIFSPFLAFSVENPIRPYATIAFVDQALSTFPTGGMTPYRYAWDNLGDFPWLSFNQNRGTFSGTPPIANIGVQQVITGNAYDALGAGPLPVEFRFTPVFAQTGYTVGGDSGDQVFVPSGGFFNLDSPDGSVRITPNTSGGIDLEVDSFPPGGNGISTVNGVGPDSGGDLEIRGIAEDSNGALYVEASGGILSLSEAIQAACSDQATAISAGAGKLTFRMPYPLTVTEVRAALTIAQTSGSIVTVDINRNGTSILSTKLTIDNTEKTSKSATAPPVISTTALNDDDEISIDVDQVGDGSAKGLTISIIGTRQPPFDDTPIIAACSDEASPLTASPSVVTFRAPYAFTLHEVRASLNVSQVSGSTLTIDINRNGSSVLSTKLTVDNGEMTSVTAFTPPVISSPAFADDDIISVDISQIGDGTAAGLKVTLLGMPT